MIFGQESETLEFKKTTGETKDAVVDVAAILNKHNRGELYFGIKNDGTVLGQMITDSTLRDVSQALTDNLKPQIYPTIETVNIDNKSCIRVQFEGDNVPYFAYGKAYMRVADECKQLSPAELEEFFKKKTIISTWDSAPSGKTTEDINTNTIRSYMKRANESGRLDYKFTNKDDILSRLQLYADGNLSNTAVAMFGKKPQTEIQMAIFATDVKHTFIDIDRKKGTILDLVDTGEKYIRSNIRWRVVRDGSPQRTEIPEIPIAAVREALLNSYAHRDWFISQTNEIAIYSNRIEIYNPGTFPKGLTPQDFIDGAGKSVRRNPLLAQIMYYSKDIESFGTGLQKIVHECEAAQVRYEFELGKLGFSVIFYRPEIIIGDITDISNGDSDGVNDGDSDGVNDGDRIGVNETQQKILEAMRNNPSISAQQLSEKIGLTKRHVETNIRTLKKDGIIDRSGPAKVGHWQVN
jgi:ATP-dependent DNA helicase RecG